MTRTGLPRRPYAEAAPPPDGLAVVRHEARRRRRRRATALAAGGASAAAVAIAVALSSTTGALDVLKPAPPAGGGLSVPSTPPAVVGHSHGSTDVLQAVGTGSSARVARPGRPAATSSHKQPSTASVNAPQPQPTEGSTRAQPQLTRYRSTYVNPFGSARLCGTQTYGNSHGIENSAGWCLAALTSSTKSGERLTVQLCRDSTSGGQLTYTGSREVDLTVKRGSSVVWQWSKLHPGQPDDHTLGAPKNGCWNWSLVWPDITQHGAAAGHGSFTFVARTTAKELGAKPTESATFTF